MPTRLKRKPFWRPLAMAVGLVGFQGYLAYNAINGQFGTLSQRQMQDDIAALKATSYALEAQIDDYEHRKSLFDPEKLDPDILTEQGRELLDMGAPTALLVMIDPVTGLPKSSSYAPSTELELSTNLAVHVD